MGFRKCGLKSTWLYVNGCTVGTGCENKCIFMGHNNLRLHISGPDQLQGAFRLALKLSQEQLGPPRTASALPQFSQRKLCPPAPRLRGQPREGSSGVTGPPPVAHTDNHPSRIHLISATSSLPHPALPLTSSPPYATFHHHQETSVYSRLQDDQTSQF